MKRRNFIFLILFLISPVVNANEPLLITKDGTVLSSGQVSYSQVKSADQLIFIAERGGAVLPAKVISFEIYNPHNSKSLQCNGSRIPKNYVKLLEKRLVPYDLYFQKILAVINKDTVHSNMIKLLVIPDVPEN